MPSESDPTTVRSIAVTAADVVAALELNRTSSDHAVLRLTPPFSGRMRARLHVEHEGGPRREYAQDPRPIHIDPETLAPGAPPYPRPGETADRLRTDPEETYTVDRHHEYHASTVAQWRERVPTTVPDRVTLDTPAGPHEVAVSLLGDLEQTDR